MSAPLTRVLSDLHYQDGDCRLVALSELEPLLAGVDHLIFNGDCLDQQRTPESDRHVADLRAFVEARVPRVTFLTGNHDPVISSQHDWSDDTGLVWAFHGDILYEHVAPWSSIADHLGHAVRAARTRLSPAERDSLASLFRVHREVCRATPVEFDPTRRDLAYRLWRMLRLLVPPTQLLAMASVWRTLPNDAVAWARRFRPQARFLLLGHSHHPGVWRRGEHIVINTGSFCRPHGQTCVDLTPDSLRVRKVEKRSGGFAPTQVLAEFPLAKSP